MAICTQVTGRPSLPACWLLCCHVGARMPSEASRPCCATLLTYSCCNTLMCVASPCRCVQDLPDVCAENSSDCWKGDHKVNGQTMTFDACTDNIETAKVGLPTVLVKRQQGPAAALHAAGLPVMSAHLADRGSSSSDSPHLPVTDHKQTLLEVDSPTFDFASPGQHADRQLCSMSACCAAWQGGSLSGGVQQAG